MGKINDLKIEMEDGVYELENLESELAWINSEMKILENRKGSVEKELKSLRVKFGFYREVLSQEGRESKQ